MLTGFDAEETQWTLQDSEIQPKIEPDGDNKYIKINYIETITEINAAQMNVNPETGEECVDSIMDQGNVTRQVESMT